MFSAPHMLWYEGCLAANQPVSGVAWCVWGARFEPAVDGVSPYERQISAKKTAGNL